VRESIIGYECTRGQQACANLVAPGLRHARELDATASHFPIPWLAHHVELVRAQMGDDFWPYGIEPNRRTLEAFCQYTHEQGYARGV